MNVPRNLIRGATRRNIRFNIHSTSFSPASSVRRIHTNAPSSRSGISKPFSALILLGVGTALYGLYTIYAPYNVWPLELKKDLRAAIRAQHQGDLILSERYLRQAWHTCRTISHTRLGSEPWLKLSGVACKLGEVLEDAHRPRLAYEIYAECLRMMQAAGGQLGHAERRRAVAVAMRLGVLADALGKREDEEKWLTWSVEESLRLHKSNKERVGSPAHPDETLVLPDWTQGEDLEAALETLGSFYAKAGNAEYAIPLYIEAISNIMHTSSTDVSEPSPQRRCRAAQLMTSISSLLMQDKPSPERLAQANAWTTSGFNITEKARSLLANPDAECERVWAVLLFNLGAVLEMQNEDQEARIYFERARSQAQSIGMPEGVREAEGALTRLSSVP